MQPSNFVELSEVLDKLEKSFSKDKEKDEEVFLMRRGW
jgi:hypothetical protein